MKMEDIEKSGMRYIAQSEKDYIPEVSDVKDAFVVGANWRINSVWHDVNEMPEDGRIIVLLGKYGTIIIYGPNMMYYKEAVIADGGFLKWAYKEDLIPNTEGEQ